MGSRTLGGTQDGGQQQKKKFKVFTPVSVKMLVEAPVGPNDAIEIDQENINEVSTTKI